MLSWLVAMQAWCVLQGAVDVDELDDEEILQNICEDLKLPSLECSKLFEIFGRVFQRPSSLCSSSPQDAGGGKATLRAADAQQQRQCSNPGAEPPEPRQEQMHQQEQLQEQKHLQQREKLFAGTKHQMQRTTVFLALQRTTVMAQEQSSQDATDCDEYQAQPQPCLVQSIASGVLVAQPKHHPSIGFSHECDVPGLRSALAEAELTNLAGRLDTWCADLGVVDLEEVLEELEDLSAEMGLDTEQELKLERALKLRVQSRGIGINSLHLCIGQGGGGAGHLPRSANVCTSTLSLANAVASIQRW